MPILTGPIIVHRRIAHVATRKMSEFSPSCVVPKTLLLSAKEEIKKPISPRATIALPSIRDGYSDCGFGSLRGDWRLRFEFAEGGCWGLVWLVEASVDGVVLVVCCPSGSWTLVGVLVKRTSTRPQASLPRIMRIVYTMPRHTMAPRNICVMGIEKPIDA